MFKIVTDSTSSLSSAQLASLGIEVVPLTIRFGDEEFIEGVTITPEEFYKRMAEYMPYGLPQTACPSHTSFEAAFKSDVEDCEGVLCITISAGLSATNQSAVMAAQTVGIDGVVVEVVDSLGVTETLTFLLEKASQMRDSGASLSETAAHMRVMAQSMYFYVALEQLENLIKGGRIGKAAGVAAGILNIKPILTINKNDGVVETAAKARGNKALIRDVISLVKAAQKKSGPCVIRFSQGNAFDKLVDFKEAFDKEGIEYDDTHVGWIGSVIGTYAGEGSIFVTMCPKELL